MEQEVTSKVTTSSKDPSTEKKLNLFATAQALLPKQEKKCV